MPRTLASFWTYHTLLPAKFRSHFKILLLTYKTLHGQTPVYTVTETLLQQTAPQIILPTCLLHPLILKPEDTFGVVAPIF